jgi:hypothetical protein
MAFAMLILTIAFSTAGKVSMEIAGFLLFTGGCALAVSWIGTLRSGQGGIVAVLAALAVPSALMIINADAPTRSVVGNFGLLGGAFLVLSCGHLLARGLLRRTRLFAGLAAFTMASLLIVVLRDVSMATAGGHALFAIVFGLQCAFLTVLAIDCTTQR